MKKITSMLLIVILSLGSIAAQAKDVPSFMEKMYDNYTADYRLSMKIHDADKIADFLEELNLSHLDKFIDAKALIESLFDVSSVMNVQAEFSRDFRKMSAAITMETDQKIVFNKNFNSSYNARMGIWIKINIDKKEFIAVYSTPLNEKYAVLDLTKDAPAEVTDELFGLFDKILSREIIEKTNKDIIQIAANHADITINRNKATLHYDNDAFTALIDDVLNYMVDFYADILPESDSEAIGFSKIPSLKGIKLLGSKGISCEFQLMGNDIKSFSEKWDISVGLADIFSKTAGTPWNYEFDGNINISVEASGSISKIGTTKVLMPILTKENSFDLADFFEDSNTNDYYIEEEPMPYISSYVWGETEKDTFDGERYYMPVRSCIEGAYSDYSVITYDNGTVTITTNTGIAGKDIVASFKVGEEKATVNGVVYDGLGTFRMIDGSVYASVDFYKNCLGWNLEYLQKDLLSGYLYYEFYTSEYEDFFE